MADGVRFIESAGKDGKVVPENVSITLCDEHGEPLKRKAEGDKFAAEVTSFLTGQCSFRPARSWNGIPFRYWGSMSNFVNAAESNDTIGKVLLDALDEQGIDSLESYIND